MKNRLPFMLVMSALALSCALADDQPLPGDGFKAAKYEALWTKSPFAVASAEAAPESTDYALVGIAQFDGISYASLIDKQSQEHFLLSSDKPVRGLTLTSIARGTGSAGGTAIVQRNGETLTLKTEDAPVGGPGPVANAAPNPPGMPTMPTMPMPGSPGVQAPMPGTVTMGSPMQRPPIRFRHIPIHIPPNPAAQQQAPTPSAQPQTSPP